MSSGKHAFRKTEAKRLVEAAIKGGMPADRLRVTHENGKLIIEVMPQAVASQQDEADSLDNWIAKRHARSTQRH
jgi:hypothetical protein